MDSLSQKFIQLALDSNALQFGEFTLKSGRISPYFFNSGEFQTGQALAKLGECYAEKLNSSNINYNLLFGPAYKGIPLVSTTAIGIANLYNKNIPYSFNRKEAKDHGEGGLIVGNKIDNKSKVIIIDDVITSGAAKHEAIKTIQEHGGDVVGILIAVDRYEKGDGELSAVQQLEQQYNIPVLSIIQFKQLLDYAEQMDKNIYQHMRLYQEKYGV